MNLAGFISSYRHHYRVTSFISTIRATLSRRPLPPGRFLVLDEAEQSDQMFLLKHAEKVGPVFKVVFEGKLTVCIVGLPLCRRFLEENSQNIRLQAMDLEDLFPLGFLRRMEGENHKKYRKAIMRGIDSEKISRDHKVFENIIADELTRYTENPAADSCSPTSYISALNAITSSLLIYIFFGACVGTERFSILKSMYNELGPEEVEWSIGEPQKRIFCQIRDYLLEELKRGEDTWEESLRQSIMGRMHSAATLDETSLGNLIYMLEIGRYDMRLLFRWLSKFGAENPEILEDIQSESTGVQQHSRVLSEAFVLETLRLSQSEVLMRIVNRDIIFDGYHIPRNFIVRLCIWESHKLQESFDDPFAFRPERFTGTPVSKHFFSPFGMDHHSCPFGNMSLKLSSIFVHTLAKNYLVAMLGSPDPARGRYHWQPADSFSVGLRPRLARS